MRILNIVLALSQVVAALSAATVSIVRPQFAPLVGNALGPWAQQAALALDAASSPAATMADSFIGNGTLTITKQVNGSVPGQTYQVTISGPSFTAPSTTLFTAGQTKVINGLISGVYTVTETLPGAGWTVTYGLTSGTGYATASSAVITLTGGSTTTPAVPPAAVAGQLNLAQYTGVPSGNTINNIPTGTPAASSQATSFALPATSNFSLRYTGAINVPSGGSYTFYTTSDDGSGLYIDGALVVNNDGLHGDVEASGVVNLTAGYHTIEVRYFDAGGGKSLTVQWAGPAIAKQPIPFTQLYTQVPATPNQVFGTVFNDANSNGLRDGAETGVAGVTVSAYDAAGTLQGTATSGATGAYALTAATNGPFRIEFTTLPAGYQPSRVFGATGVGANGTSTQFVTGGNTSVNFGVAAPDDYCQANPDMCTTVAFNGAATSSNNAIPRFSYNSASTTPGVTGQTAMATNANVGSVWGIAYKRDTKKIYAAAYLRRHIGLGPGGLGAIYELDNANPGSVSVWTTVTGVGASPRTVALPAGASNIPSYDDEVYTSVGKVGLGDIDISPDGRTLYVMNLTTRNLVAIDTSSKAEIASYSVTANNPGCLTTNEIRPWATKVNAAGVFIGVVCSGEDSGTLNAYVMKLNGTTFTTIASTPLNYSRDAVWSATACNNGALSAWKAWISTWPPGANQCGTLSPNNTAIVYPQPILSDIEFDNNGSIILGFTDRMSLQGGNQNFAYSSAPSTAGYSVLAGGDIRRICYVGTSYIPENNAGCAYQSGENEYYPGEQYYGLPQNANHDETALGGLALLPGSSVVATTVYNPVNGGIGYTDAGGVKWLDNTTGASTRGYFLYPSTNGYLGKAGGLGDLELLCDAAPIEIGNRVWRDVNNNGVQDAGEPPLAGVVVTLQTPQGPIQTTTDISGTYYFTREAATGPYSQTLRPNTAYTVTIDPGQPVLSGYSLTPPNTQAISGSPTSNDNILDTRDSDASVIGGLATIYYTTGGPGVNNHGLDFGFASPPPFGSVIIVNTPPIELTATKTVNQQLVQPGDLITYTIRVTNIGQFLATAVSVNDTLPVELRFRSAASSVPGVTYVAPNFVPPFNLDVGAGAVFTLSAIVGSNVISGQIIRNVAVITTPFTPPLTPTVEITPSDKPGISLRKYTLGFDADAPPGPLVRVGQVITWTYVATNTGNLTLTNFTLTDNQIGVIALSTCAPSPVPQFLPGQVVTCSVAGIATANPGTGGQYANTGIVTGTPPGGPVVSDTNLSHYYSVTPSIALRKYTNGYDADVLGVNPQPFIPAGQPVTWTYVVTNTGTVTLTNFQLVDDRAGAINPATCLPANPLPNFLAGQVVTCTLVSVALPNLATGGQYTNTAVVSGTPTLSGTVIMTPDLPGFPPLPPLTATNPSHYVSLTPAIALRKYTNGYDADTLPLSCNGVPSFTNQYCGFPNDPITWTYRITNTGNATLTDFTLVDDQLGPINPANCTPNPLPNFLPGQVTQCTQPGGIAILGQYTNTAVVSGTFTPPVPSGPPDLPNSPPPYTTPTVLTATNPSHYFTELPRPGIALRKYTNGYDADTPTGPLVKVGQAITWTFIATNTGNLPLTNFTLTDDKLGVIPASACAPNPLPVFARDQVVTCTVSGIALAGQYANTGIVTGTPPFGPPVTDTNPSHYYAITPSIALRKYTNGYDADQLPLSCNGTPTFANQYCGRPGDAIIWTYRITNTGDVTLTNFQLVDDKLGGINPANCTPNPLPDFVPGQVVVCTTTGVAILGQYTNTAVVTGTPKLTPTVPLTPDLPGFPPTPPITTPLTATNPSHYFTEVPGPGIRLRKYTNGYDADVLGRDPQPFIPAGQPVTWTYVAANSGDVPLTNFTLTDDKIGPINPASCTPSPLPTFGVGAVTTCTVSGLATVGQYTNTGTVTGTPPSGPPVTSTNPSHYIGYTPSIDLRKYTNGYDADQLPLSCNGVPRLSNQYCGRPGDPITWTYRVTNTSAVTLTNFTLTDDKIGPINPANCTPSPLPNFLPGQVTQCTATGIAILGQYTNTAVVSGTFTPPPLPPPDLPSFPTPITTPVVLTATNPSHYFTRVPGPEITLVKYTNGYDADLLGRDPQPVVRVGQTVTWTYVAANTGNVELTNFTLVDDKIGPINPASCTPSPLPTFGVGAVTTCTVTGIATAGQYTNTAVVSGTPPSGPPVTSTNPSHYVGYTPSIDLRKYTNGYDADTLPLSCNGVPGAGNQYCGTVGDAITWTYRITNTGDVTLTNFALVDDKVGGISPANCTPSPLPNFAPGQVIQCTATGIAILGQYTNTAVVSGTFTPPTLPPPDLPGFPVPPTPPVVLTATNPSHYATNLPVLRLIKTASIGNKPSAKVGDLITYTLVVTNIGLGVAYNTVITDPVPVATMYMTDSARPPATLSNNMLSWTLGTLLPGQAVTLTYQLRIMVVSAAGMIMNVAYAQADGLPTPTPGTPPVRSSDDAGVPVEPTAVILTLFRAAWVSDAARPNGGYVRIVWETGSEINTFGFGLYRSADGSRASAVLVTPELIRSTSRNNAGSSYAFDDTMAQPGVVYTYWLQELETTGDLLEYGPVNTNGLEINRPMPVRFYLPSFYNQKP